MSGNFSQALPRDDTVSRYTRPTFLYWDHDIACLAFGESIMLDLQENAEAVGLVLAGIVGRPLYACTALKRQGTAKAETPCRAIASMSPLLEFPEERKEWRCADCLRRHAPVSDSVPRRLLRVYPLVWITGTSMTPMRSPPVSLYVFVPPESFSWGHIAAPDPETPAVPRKLPDNDRGMLFEFSRPESDFIWLAARSYKETTFPEDANL